MKTFLDDGEIVGFTQGTGGELVVLFGFVKPQAATSLALDLVELEKNARVFRSEMLHQRMLTVRYQELTTTAFLDGINIRDYE